MKEKNKEKINQAPDPYVKVSLSRQEVAIDFLKGHLPKLPKKLLDMLDLESLELIKESFITAYLPTQWPSEDPLLPRARSFFPQQY